MCVCVRERLLMCVSLAPGGEWWNCGGWRLQVADVMLTWTGPSKQSTLSTARRLCSASVALVGCGALLRRAKGSVLRWVHGA